MPPPMAMGRILFMERLIAKRGADGLRGADAFTLGIDKTQLPDSLRDRNIAKLSSPDIHHPAPALLRGQFHGMNAEMGGQPPVLRRRDPSALKMAQDHDSGLVAGAPFDFGGDLMTDASQPRPFVGSHEGPLGD